jgi:alkylation response protein AidB-like acyl-CoA dehydrogenase
VSLNKRNLEFLLFEFLNAQSLTARARFEDHDRGVFEGVLEVALELARKELAPHNRSNDLEEPRLENGRVIVNPAIKPALEKLREAGFFAAGADAELGGLQLPNVAWNAAQAVFLAANCGTTSYAFLTIGAANLISSFGSAAQKARYLQPMLEGRWFGTMCLSEPHAGSSLAEILTRAEPAADGSYRVSGSKMWISGGDHELSENIVHMVLARLPGAPAGVKGISLLIVPKFRVAANGELERNDMVTAGLNHKMGYRGTSNCLLSFGERNDCYAELVGEPHQGLMYMFQMMNEARISVGLGGAALACAGFEYSLGYAKERRQGRALSGQANARIIEHPDVKRMLLAQKALAEGALTLCLYASSLVDDEKTHPDEAARHESHALLELLTPIVKAWSTHYGLEANSHAIQILGGYGYTRDYPVEQYYRDNRLNPIHEGTNGIQALDLLGRKVLADQGLGLRLLAGRITDCAAQAARHSDLQGFARALEDALEVASKTTKKLLRASEQPELMLANAWHYLELLGHVVVAWLWLEQATVAQAALEREVSAPDQDFYRGKIQTMTYFYKFELPKVAVWGALLSNLDATTIQMQEDWF